MEVAGQVTVFIACCIVIIPSTPFFIGSTNRFVIFTEYYSRNVVVCQQLVSRVKR